VFEGPVELKVKQAGAFREFTPDDVIGAGEFYYRKQGQWVPVRRYLVGWGEFAWGERDWGGGVGSDR
jgi:hypothetical protein